MLNKKKIIAATGVLVVVCGVLVYVGYNNMESTPKNVQESVITEQQEVESDYNEILDGIEVDEDSNIIVNPTIDEDTGAMSGENSKGEFIQTPPINVPESDEEQLKELLEAAGVPKNEIDEAVKNEYPAEQEKVEIKPVEKPAPVVKPAEPVKPVQPSKPAEPVKPVETKPVQQPKPVEKQNKPAVNNNSKPWEGKSPLANSDPGEGIHIKPGEGSGETTDTTVFN